jgi:hypothetical protein
MNLQNTFRPIPFKSTMITRSACSLFLTAQASFSLVCPALLGPPAPIHHCPTLVGAVASREGPRCGYCGRSAGGLLWGPTNTALGLKWEKSADSSDANLSIEQHTPYAAYTCKAQTLNMITRKREDEQVYLPASNYTPSHVIVPRVLN